LAYLGRARDRAAAQLALLPYQFRRLDHPATYSVSFTAELRARRLEVEKSIIERLPGD
jgi:hypothetical protein